MPSQVIQYEEAQPVEGPLQLTTEQQEEKIDFETAFIVVKAFDGSFHVLTELGAAFTVDRLSDRTDIKQACTDLLDSMTAERVALAVLSKIGQNSTEDSQRKVDAIRQSLITRNIL